MIKTTLNRESASNLFEENAILFSGNDAVPEYRIYELFGEAAADYWESSSHRIDGTFVPGKHWNACGACSEERPFIHYFYKAGFMQFVSNHNYLLTVAAHRQSEGGHMADAVSERETQRLAELDAAEERKRQERKAKRAAAAAAKKGV